MRSRLFSRRQSILSIFQTTLAVSVGGFWLGSAKAQVDKLTITGLSEARLKRWCALMCKAKNSKKNV